MKINEVSKWFLSNCANCVALFSDKAILNEKRISVSDLEQVARRYKYEYIDLGENFLLSQSRFC